MSVKDLSSFQKKIDQCSLESPPVILISGSDTGLLKSVQDRLAARLSKEVGAFETILFTGETGEDLRLEEEAFNVPLFAPYRVLLVKQAEVIFKPILAHSKSAKERYEGLRDHFTRLPDRTLLLIEYNGKLPAKIKNLFGKRLLAFETRNLYPNQVADVIRDVSHRLKLHLSADSLHFLAEHAEPKAAAIEQMLLNLKAMLGEISDEPLTPLHIREVLFPGQGCDSFALVDAFFAQDRRSVKRELVRFNPDSDNYLGILKLMLNRANEIRKYQVAQKSGLQSAEILSVLGIEGRHPFVQKKILARLRKEASQNPPSKLSRIYDFLIEIETAFKSGVAEQNQAVFFEQRSFQIFL